jgi:hypothetical protein
MLDAQAAIAASRNKPREKWMLGISIEFGKNVGGKTFYLLSFDAFADSEYVAVGVTDVHFADVPGLVGRGPRDFDSLLDAAGVNGVDIVDPDAHPHAFVSGFAAAISEGRCVRAFAATALCALAQEDFAMSRAHGAESGRIAPLEASLPAEFFEPGEALLDVGDV